MKANPALRKKILLFVTSSALIFYAISGFTALINYVFYPVVSRLVTVEQYGEIQFLVSSFNQLAVGFVVLNILAIILALKTQNDAEKNEKVHSLNVVAGIFASVLSIIGVGMLIIYAEPLQLSQPLAIIALGISLLVNVPLTTAIGHLQGLGRFVSAGVVGLVAALAKLFFSVLFVFIGWGVTGAIAGIVVGMLCAVVLGYLLLGKLTVVHSRKSLSHHLGELAHIRYLAVAGLLGLSLLTLLSTVDLIASRVTLTAEEAGQYAAVATLAKIILAIGSPLMWLALPLAIERRYRKIVQYLLVTVGLCAGLILIFSLNPSFITSLSMGIDPRSFGPLLPLAALSMAFYALAFILVSALLCLDRVKSLVILSCVTLAVTFIAAFYLIETQTLSVLTVLLVQAAIGFGICLASTLLLYKDARK